MAKKEYYHVHPKCTNCGYSPCYSKHPKSLYWVGIPKGTAVSAFLRDSKCAGCGCTGTWKARGT